MSLTEHLLVAAPVTREAFAPFGSLLAVGGPGRLASDLYEGRDDTALAATLDSDHPVQLLALRSERWDRRVRYLERHVEIGQAFLPLGGRPYAVVVAEPDAPETDDGLPSLEALSVFVVPGDVGVVLHRGTWHEPPLAVEDEGMWLVTSHAALTAALDAGFDAGGEIHAGDVDKRAVTARAGVEVHVRLP